MQKGPPWDAANRNCKSGVNAARRRRFFYFRKLHFAACIIQPMGVYLGETSCRDVKGEAPTAQRIDSINFPTFGEQSENVIVCFVKDFVQE